MNDFFNLLLSQRDFFFGLVWDHIWISGVAVFFALIVGVSLGIFISYKQSWASFIIGLVNILYTTPSIALLGILISITGIGNRTAIIALALYALLPMVRATYTGISGVDPLLVEAAEGMGSTRRQILARVQLPLAFPVMMSGFRNMVTMTLALGGIASFVGAGGLGVAIYRGITTNNQAMTLAGSLLVAVLALFFDFILSLLEKSINQHRKLSKKWTLGLSGGAVIALAALAIFQMNPGGGTVKIATKPQTENYILGEMQKQVIEEYTDLKVKMTKGVGGGTSNIHPAMVKGDFDIYADYTGTLWEVVLKKDGTYSEEQFDSLTADYQKAFNLTWVGSFGFNNTYRLAVSKETADRYKLKNNSDLSAASPNLSFGAEYDFFAIDAGYDRLVQTYNLSFKSTVDMDSGLKYQAVKEGQVDVIDIFTTDGRLHNSGLVMLEDDRHMWSSYQAGSIVRQETLDRYPELKTALAKLDNILDDAAMSDLNYQVDMDKQEPEQAAHDYLVEKGVLKR